MAMGPNPLPSGGLSDPAGVRERSVNTLNAAVGRVVFAFSLTVGAHAAPITYEISGVASGQIGSTTFTDAEVDLTGTADTNNITSFVAGGAADWGALAGDTIFANPFSGFT